MAEIGCRAFGRLRLLEPVLREWANLVHRYGAQYADEGDAAYWYTERATLSFLAGAAWREGRLVMEEYSTRKRGGKKGRADLWFEVSPRGRNIAIEAKWRSPTALLSHVPAIVEQQLERASKAARQLPRTESHLRGGIVFLTPRVAPRKKFEPQAFVRAARSVKHDFIAWSFADAGKWPQGSTGHLWPGVVLAGRLV